MARFGIGILAAHCLAGCALVPDLPGDFGFPIQEIVRHSACEIRNTFPQLHGLPGFNNADEWAVGIVLTPKADTQITGRGGITRRSNLTTTFESWALGATPGAGLDLKGHRDGSVTYTFHTRDLLDPTFVIDCENWSNAHHSLVQYLGLSDWLRRIIAIPNGVDGRPLVTMEKPTFNTQIVIKFDGTGNFTYNFPLGTNFASLFGSYALDETLQISMTPDPKRKPVVTLPPGGTFPGSTLVPTSGISDGARRRLDEMQIEQLLRNLQTRPIQ